MYFSRNFSITCQIYFLYNIFLLCLLCSTSAFLSSFSFLTSFLSFFFVSESILLEICFLIFLKNQLLGLVLVLFISALLLFLFLSLFSCSFFFFLTALEGLWTLVPLPGIEPRPLAVMRVRSPKHWTAENSLLFLFKIYN